VHKIAETARNKGRERSGVVILHLHILKEPGVPKMLLENLVK
jgi:hypothetical protein